MESWGVFFLGLIALASLVQAGFLVALAFAGRRVAARVDEIQRQLDRDIRPALDNLTRLTRNVGEISDRAVLQARRIDDAIGGVLRELDATVRALKHTASASLGPLFNVTALLKGVRTAMQVYHQLRGFDRQRRGSGQRYAEDDEHLFI